MYDGLLFNEFSQNRNISDLKITLNDLNNYFEDSNIKFEKSNLTKMFQYLILANYNIVLSLNALLIKSQLLHLIDQNEVK